MSDELFVKVDAFTLFHSEDHNACAYIGESEIDVDLELNGATVAPLIPTWGNTVIYTLFAVKEDRLKIRIRPKNTAFFPIEGNFLYQGEGRFKRDGDSAIERAAFAMPQGLDLLGSGSPRFTLTIFRGFLAPILEVNGKVRDIIRGRFPQLDIFSTLEQPEDIYVINFPPMEQSGTPPKYERRLVDPAASLRCFELAGPASLVPRLILTSLPKNLEPVLFESDEPKRLSYLMMLHPYLGPYYVGDPYPYGIKHLWDAGLKYMGYQGLNPILSKYPNGTSKNGTKVDSSLEDMGLPHQMAAGGKKVAVVLPMNFGASIGRFMEGGFTHRILHDVYAWELRAQELHIDPADIGPCAVAGFSSGNQIMATFLNQNRGQRFCDQKILEVYSMDAPPLTHALEQIVDAAENWMKRGTPDKKFRVYTQEPSHPKFAKFKEQKDNWPRPAYVLDRAGERTLVSTPATSLTAAAAALDPNFKKRFPGGYSGGDGDAHRLINQTMLVDAARRSVFPDL